MKAEKSVPSTITYHTMAHAIRRAYDSGRARDHQGYQEEMYSLRKAEPRKQWDDSQPNVTISQALGTISEDPITPRGQISCLF